MDVSIETLLKELGLNWYWLLAAAFMAKATVKLWLELQLPKAYTGLVSYLSAFLILLLVLQPWAGAWGEWASLFVGAALAGTLETLWYHKVRPQAEEAQK